MPNSNTLVVGLELNAAVVIFEDVAETQMVDTYQISKQHFHYVVKQSHPKFYVEGSWRHM